jgi:hypothetical protein
MPAEISCFRSSSSVGNIARDPLASEGTALTAAPVNSATASSGARVVCVSATENLRFEYAGSPSATATSHYVASGERLWLKANVRSIFSVRTA